MKHRKHILGLTVAIIGLTSISQAAVIMTFDTRDEFGGGATNTTVGQTALAAGESPSSGVLDANLEASNLTFGSGTSGSNTTATMFTINGINNTTVAGALAAGEYLSFTVDAKDGYEVAVDTMRLGLRFQSGGAGWGWGLYSSVDSFAAQLDGETGTFVQDYEVTTSSLGITGQTAPIEFRIAIAAPNQFSSAGMADVGTPSGWPDYGQAIQVNGTVTTVPEPATVGMLGLAALVVIARRNRRS